MSARSGRVPRRRIRSYADAVLRRATRWFSLTGFLLAGLCFVLPFVTVSCDVPGGYGRAAPGGSTTYAGIDLVAGDRPEVRPTENERPLDGRPDDRVGPQPLAIAALVLAGAGAVTAGLARVRVRRASAALIGLAAAGCLAANQVVTQKLLADRIAAQLTAPLPAGKVPASYVHTEAGVLICLLLFVVTGLGNAVAWLVAMRRRTGAGAAGKLPAL
jgi:hypothetical protein